MKPHKTTDILVIGGGIIGVAIARALKNRMPSVTVALAEKESEIGRHQSSHSSNVIHAGIYYKPQSLKAQLCTKGFRMIYDYCNSKNIPVNKCGKLIIATDEMEVIRLKVLHDRGLKNDVPGLQLLKNDEMTKIQPLCAGLAGLWSPHSGNVAWALVTKSLSEDFISQGGHLWLNTEAKSIKDSPLSSHPLRIDCNNGQVMAKYVVINTGLQSGQLLESDDKKQHRTVSFRVNYGLLDSSLRRFIRTNIYALPHIELPFIGCHISPLVDGTVAVGPNAVPGLKLEDYRGNNMDPTYLWEVLSTKGLVLMALKNASTSLAQFRQSTCKDTQARILKRYMPMISKDDIEPGQRSVQTQLIDENGDFVDDFIIDMLEGDGIRRRIVNCRFIPSPGATSSLAIAQLVADKMVDGYVE